MAIFHLIRYDESAREVVTRDFRQSQGQNIILTFSEVVFDANSFLCKNILRDRNQVEINKYIPYIFDWFQLYWSSLITNSTEIELNQCYVEYCKRCMANNYQLFQTRVREFRIYWYLESKHYHLCNMNMLLYSKLPLVFWDGWMNCIVRYAWLTAIHNRTLCIKHIGPDVFYNKNGLERWSK